MDWFFLLILVVLVGAAIWAFKGQMSNDDSGEENLEAASPEHLESPKAAE